MIQAPGSIIGGLIQIQLHPARLLNDFTLVGGEGAALVNASILAACGLLLVRLQKVRLSGPTIAALWTIFGFGLFGKTPVNAVPIVLGVAAAARIAGKPFREYILMALFGTTLGPLITALAFESGLPVAAAYFLAAAGGITAGILLPPGRNHHAPSAPGLQPLQHWPHRRLIGLFAASLLAASGTPIRTSFVWNSEPSIGFILLVPLVSLLLIIASLLGRPKTTFTEFIEIARLPGRLPSDFMSMVSVDGTLLNMGIIGLATWGYVLAEAI